MAYPPNEEESRALFVELQELDSAPSKGYVTRKYEIIHDLAEARFYEAKPYFISGLDDPDPDYRWSCISALITHWQARDSQIVSRLLNMARNDPDASVRDIAIDSLGILAVQESLPLLKQIVENSQEDPDLRKIAYLSILRTLDRPLAEIQMVRQRDFDPGLVDWSLLLAISNADEQS